MDEELDGVEFMDVDEINDVSVNDVPSESLMNKRCPTKVSKIEEKCENLDKRSRSTDIKSDKSNAKKIVESKKLIDQAGLGAQSNNIHKESHVQKESTETTEVVTDEKVSTEANVREKKCSDTDGITKHSKSSSENVKRRRSNKYRSKKSRSRSRSRKHQSRSRSGKYSSQHSTHSKHKSTAKKRRKSSSKSSTDSDSSISSEHKNEHRNKKRKINSPFSNRKRHTGCKENPPPSQSIVVFGLPMSFKSDDLKSLLSVADNLNPPTSTAVAMDKISGLSRGFGFINFETVENASSALNYLQNVVFESFEITCNFSITHRSHSPTPNYYLGCKKTLKSLSDMAPMTRTVPIVQSTKTLDL